MEDAGSVLAEAGEWARRGNEEHEGRHSSFTSVVCGSPPKNPKFRAFDCNNNAKQMLREETEVSGDFADDKS